MVEERASGGRWDRPALHGLIEDLREGDILVVWKLDRLSRSLNDTLALLETIEAAGAGFRSLTEAIDTSGPAGRMMMQMLGAFAEFERAMVRERTRAGLDAARARGRVGGRRPKLDPEQRAEALAMLAAGRPAAEVARVFRLHRATVGRLKAAARLEGSGNGRRAAGKDEPQRRAGQSSPRDPRRRAYDSTPFRSHARSEPGMIEGSRDAAARPGTLDCLTLHPELDTLYLP